jgi:endonuclease YncB( thermonuclease family)
MNWAKLLVAAALLVSAAPIVNAQIGSASVIDGDTIDVAGIRIRLWGIDAPESTQICLLNAQPWQCGRDASKALAGWLGRRSVACEARIKDRYGRTVAVCKVEGEDLSAWLVINGWALAFRRYSMDYVADEARARVKRVGIWASEFQLPWDWRAAKRGQKSR